VGGIYAWLALLPAGSKAHHYIPYFFKIHFKGSEDKGNHKMEELLTKSLSAHLILPAFHCLSLSILCLKEPDSDRYMRMNLVGWQV
jgi:hypothetical protein